MEEYVSSANKTRDTETLESAQEMSDHVQNASRSDAAMSETQSRSLHGDAHLGERGNGPVRAASMQGMQMAYGNRAIQRFMSQPTTLTASKVPSIQRWPDLGGLLETITEDVDWRTGPANPGAFPSFPKEVNEYAEPKGNIESAPKAHPDYTRQVQDTPGYSSYSGYGNETSYGGGGNDYGYGNVPPSYTPPSYTPPAKPPKYKPPIKPPAPPAPPSYTPPSYTPPSYSSGPSYDYGNEEYEDSDEYGYSDVTPEYGNDTSYGGGGNDYGYDDVTPSYTPPIKPPSYTPPTPPSYTPPTKPPSYTPPVKPPPPAPPTYTLPSYTPPPGYSPPGYTPPSYTPPVKPPSYTPSAPPSYSIPPSYSYGGEPSYGGSGHLYEQSEGSTQYSNEPTYSSNPLYNPGAMSGAAPSDGGFREGFEGDPLNGFQGKFSALHDERSILGIPTTFDAITGEAKVGEFEESNPDGSTETRSGVSVSGGLGKTTFNKDGLISGDVGAGTFGADASIGTNGATLGATANLGEGSITGGNFSDKSNTDESIRVGLSEGVGLAGRLHWGDSDQDGHREFGAGVDAGFFSMDVKTEDPLRTLMGMPGIGPLNPFAKAGIDAKDMLFPGQKSNMTEDLLGAASGSDKPVSTGSVWDRAIDLLPD